MQLKTKTGILLLKSWFSHQSFDKKECIVFDFIHQLLQCHLLFDCFQSSQTENSDLTDVFYSLCFG